jgi:hypothetical protein
LKRSEKESENARFGYYCDWVWEERKELASKKRAPLEEEHLFQQEKNWNTHLVASQTYYAAKTLCSDDSSQTPITLTPMQISL